MNEEFWLIKKDRLLGAAVGLHHGEFWEAGSGLHKATQSEKGQIIWKYFLLQCCDCKHFLALWNSFNSLGISRFLRSLRWLLT